MRKVSRNGQRGSALIAVLLLGAVALTVSVALLAYSGKEWTQARRAVRPKQALSCAESGLQYARALFGNNYDQWNTYLGAGKAPYVNVVQSADGKLPSKTDANYPAELFGDMDGDGRPDFFVYVRDNVDDTNPNRDNDQVVLIGALCLDGTLNPKDLEYAGAPARSTAGVEAALAYSADVEQYQGAMGTGNGN